MRKILLVTILLLLLIRDVDAQEKIYLPIIFQEKANMTCEYPILAIASDSGERINLLDEGSGLQLADPYWQPATSDTSPTYVNPQTTDGSSLIHTKYNNVVETIPIRITGEQGHVTIRNLRRAFNLSVNAQGYWTQIFEQDKVWLEILPKGDNFLTAYSTIYEIRIVGLSSPFTSPFANPIDKSQFDTISIVITREPFTSPLKPGEIIGPLYNLIKNPDFELWNFGVGDSQPDSWDDLQTISIIGTNNRTQSDVKWGNNAIKVSVTGSTAIGEAKGVTQVIEDTQNNTTYTILAWIKNDGISNGVGRILVNYSNQLELYRDDSIHGWQLYSGTITTGVDDTVSINLQILSTGNNTLGDVFFDGLMFVEGDWTDEAADNLIGYMTSSHIVNHQDTDTGVIEAGDINFVDMWNIPGDVDSEIRLEVTNNTTPANFSNVIELYKQIRIGMRRTGNVFQFDNINDPGGTVDTTAASDNRFDIASVTTDWQDITTKTINGGDIVKNNVGRFKLLARVFDESSSPTLQIRVSYFVGGGSLDRVFIASTTSNITSNWQIVDLTNNDIMNQLLTKEEIPGQIGYTIQMRRTSGTEGARLDYGLILPTDGGFLDATMNPALREGDRLTIDKRITSNVLESTWLKDSDVVENGGVYDVVDFNNTLYAVGRDTDANKSAIWKRVNANLWSTVFNGSAGGASIAQTIETYQNELFAGTNNRIYSSPDGDNWSLELSTPLATYYVDSIVFNNKLWFVNLGTFGAFEPTVVNYDGSSWSTNFTLPNDTDLPRFFAIYANTLYLIVDDSGGNGVIYEYDSIADTWSNVHSDTMSSPRNGKDFNNILYVVNGDSDSLLTYDGSVWQKIAPDLDGNNPRYVELYDNALYVATTGGVVYFSTNGANFTRIGTLPANVSNMTVFNNELWAVIFSQDSIYRHTRNDSVYSVPTYKGGTFSAPPRTLQSDSRHRYFFSYDRENFVNNIDDKALIGIGYRPRFFSIINKDSF